NFAVSGDIVQTMLLGRIQKLFYRADRVGKQVRMQMKVECLDPFRSIGQVGLEYWTGPKGSPRPPSDSPPAPQRGDSAHRTVYFNRQFEAEVLRPRLQPGQVYWFQPILVDKSGQRHWDLALDYAPKVSSSPGNPKLPGTYQPSPFRPGIFP